LPCCSIWSALNSADRNGGCSLSRMRGTRLLRRRALKRCTIGALVFKLKISLLRGKASSRWNSALGHAKKFYILHWVAGCAARRLSRGVTILHKQQALASAVENEWTTRACSDQSSSSIQNGRPRCLVEFSASQRLSKWTKR